MGADELILPEDEAFGGADSYAAASALAAAMGKICAYDLILCGRQAADWIVIAISEASQHMSGCSGSKTIVAINKDPAATIFERRNTTWLAIGRRPCRRSSGR